MSRRRGFTMIELMLVVVIVGVMAIFGFPKMRESLRRNDVRGARTKLVALYNKARATAIESNRHAALRLTPTLAVVTVNRAGGVVDTVWVEDFGSNHGVTLTTSTSTLTVDPRGVAAGLGTSTATIVITKGPYADTVRVTGFGRVIAQ